MPKNTEDDDNKPNTGVEDEVDTSQEEDENADDQDEEDVNDDGSEENDDDSEDDDDDGENEDDDDSEEDDSKFKKQFPSIKGDTPEEYTSNLEETYRKSSREGKRLAKENQDQQQRLDQIAAAVAKNPELAKLITEATGEDAISPVQDPALLHAREEMNKKMETEYNAFVDEHPELDSDEDLQQKVLAELQTLGAAYRAKGKVLSMEKGLKLAWDSLGLDDGDSKEKIAGAAKNTAARGKTPSGGKKTPKKSNGLTAEQIAYGKRFGLSEKQMLEFANK